MSVNLTPVEPETQEQPKYNKPEPNKVPEALKDNNIGKVNMKNIAESIKTKIEQIKDISTMEMMLKCNVRANNRYKAIIEAFSAESFNIDDEWYTQGPKMHMAGLPKKKRISDDHYQLIVDLYDTDKDGNKVVYENNIEVTRPNGDKVMRNISAEYRKRYRIIEDIKAGKPVTRDVIDLFEGRKDK